MGCVENSETPHCGSVLIFVPPTLKQFSIGRSDWAQSSIGIDKNGKTFESGRSIGGIKNTSRNCMVPTNLVHIVVGPGKGTWDRNKQKYITSTNTTSQPCWEKNQFPSPAPKNTKTKMTALARSIDLKGGRTDFH